MWHLKCNKHIPEALCRCIVNTMYKPPVPWKETKNPRSWESDNVEWKRTTRMTKTKKTKNPQLNFAPNVLLAIRWWPVFLLSINSPEKLNANRATGRASLMKNIFQGLFSPATGEQVSTWMDVTAALASVPLKWTKQGFIHIYHPDMWFCSLNKQDHYTAILVTWRTWRKRRQPQILAYRLQKGPGHLRSLLVPADKPALHRHSLEGTKDANGRRNYHSR